MKVNSYEHKKGLINLYQLQILHETPYMTAVLKKAILSLRNGSKPRMVENWVVKMEHEMMKRI
jgi:hypothetical protein